MSQEDKTLDSSTDFDISGSSGSYQLEWTSLKISCKVTHLQENSHYELRGYVTFTSERPTSKGHLRGGSLLLTSPQSRASFAKQLEKREPTVDWDECMEQLCENIIGRQRQGAEVVVLNSEYLPYVDSSDENQFSVYPVLENESATIFYGHGSHGKSLLAQYIAVLCDEGISGVGIRVDRKIPVLYLDYETNDKQLFRRVQSIRKGLGLSPNSTINYRPMASSLVSDIEQIREICRDKDIGLIVIDSISGACGGEQEAQKPIKDMMTAIRSIQIDLKMSALYIGHVNKQEQMFGSVFQFYDARNVFNVRKDQKEGDASLSVGLFHQKSNDGLLRQPMGYKVSFNDGLCTLSSHDVRDSGLEQHLNMKERIASLMRNKTGGMSPADLAEDLGKTETHIRKELSEGVRNYKMFVRLENGNYANVTRGDDDIQWELN